MAMCPPGAVTPPLGGAGAHTTHQVVNSGGSSYTYTHGRLTRGLYPCGTQGTRGELGRSSPRAVVSPARGRRPVLAWAYLVHQQGGLAVGAQGQGAVGAPRARRAVAHAVHALAPVVARVEAGRVPGRPALAHAAKALLNAHALQLLPRQRLQGHTSRCSEALERVPVTVRCRVPCARLSAANSPRCSRRRASPAGSHTGRAPRCSFHAGSTWRRT